MSPVRLGVPTVVTAYPPATGVGKVWSHILPALETCGAVVEVDPHRHRRVDAWLTDGHQGPLAVEGPWVAHLQEAAWDDPELAELLESSFVDAYAEPSRLAARRATRVITPSRSSRRQVVDNYGVDPAAVVAIAHGVDTGVYRADLDREGRALVARHDRDGSAGPYVLFVSTLHPRKNLQALRTAMAGLADRGLPHRLVVVWSHPPDRRDADDLKRSALAELPGHPGRLVALHGLAERELAGVMAGADVLCAPSLMEGFGLAPLEAMACGTPAVVSDRGSLPEVVGDAGVVVKPTAEDSTAALVALLSSPDRLARLGARARARALGLSWGAAAEGWMAIVRSAVDAGPGRRGPSAGRGRPGLRPRRRIA